METPTTNQRRCNHSWWPEANVRQQTRSLSVPDINSTDNNQPITSGALSDPVAVYTVAQHKTLMQYKNTSKKIITPRNQFITKKQKIHLKQ